MSPPLVQVSVNICPDRQASGKLLSKSQNKVSRKQTALSIIHSKKLITFNSEVFKIAWILSLSREEPYLL
jgi:hypothetical protein